MNLNYVSKTYVNPDSNHFIETDIMIADKIYEYIKQKSGKTIIQLAKVYIETIKLDGLMRRHFRCLMQQCTVYFNQ